MVATLPGVRRPNGDPVEAVATFPVDAQGNNANPTDGALTAGWNGSPVALSGYGSVFVSFTGISGGDSYVIQGSLAGTTYRTLSGINLADTSSVTTITADGIYAFPATGFVQAVKTGSASTPTVNLLLKR